MKAKVLKPFTDKVNGKTYKKNEVIEVTAARFNEIIRKGAFIEAVENIKTEKQ